MKKLFTVFLGFLILSSCGKKDDPEAPVAVVTPVSNDASITSITLGTEKFNVTVPAAGTTTTLDNAPRTLLSIITAVPVNISATDGATIKMGTKDFTQGQNVNFSSPVTFTVTAKGGTTTKAYTLVITAYSPYSNHYGVYTAAHLNDVRNDKVGSYKMMNNITLPALNDANAVAATGINDYTTKGWLPIAHDAVVKFDNYYVNTNIGGGFTGTFDGGNFSINNFYINRTIEYAGLFGVTYRATLKNLGVTGTTSSAVTASRCVGALAGFINQSRVTGCYTSVNISVSFTADFSGSVGGLVGLSYESNEINNCHATGSVSSTNTNVNASVLAGGLVGEDQVNGRFINCYATGSVSSSSAYTSFIGGFVGNGSGWFSNCYATGSVSVSVSSPPSSSSFSRAYAGGFAGNVGGDISNCYATGSVSSSSAAAASAGGFMAWGAGTISNCYATGSVSSSSSSAVDYAYAGGLLGLLGDGSMINNCHATGSVSSSSPSSSHAGGLLGDSYTITISNCYTTGNVSSSSTSSSYAGGLLGTSNEATFSNCYAAGSVSSSLATASVGGLLGKSKTSTFSNCYRNSGAVIKKNNNTVEPDDHSITGITGMPKGEMQTDAFTTSLNKGTTVWERSSGKNDGLPYIKGVGN